MDVRCDRCKTEYEFDDTRITEAGVTVKCTTCGHVFKVKKKALVVTVPVSPEDAPGAEIQEAPFISGPPGAPSPSGEKPREWKVRQANGNVFTFKELTTLQKWIVERKVTREDEISLTGETWKRLGNIAELASFFQVVDEAQRGQQLQTLQSAAAMGYLGPAMTPAGGYAIPSGDSIASQLMGGVPPPGMRATPAGMPQPQPMPAAPAVSVTVQAPISAAAPLAALAEDDLAAAKVKRGGFGKALLAVLVLVALGGGGYVGYFSYWLPRQEAERLAAEDARAKAEREERERREAEERAAAEKAAQEEAARAAAAAAAAPVDAGTAVSEATVGTSGKKVVRDFDYWMNQGDSLRERERAEAALDAYGRAADMQPDRAEPHAGRGLAMLDMGNKLQAEGLFLQALKLNPRYGVAIMGLAETYRGLGRNDEAVKYYERYLDVLPSGPEAQVARTALQRLQQ